MELTSKRLAVFEELEAPVSESPRNVSSHDQYVRNFEDSQGNAFEFSAYKEDEGPSWILYFESIHRGSHAFRPTGRGNQFEVYKILLGFVQDFIHSMKPSEFTFDSSNKKLQKVYRKFLERFFPGQWVEEGGQGDFIVTPDYGTLGTTANRRSRLSRVSRHIQAIFSREEMEATEAPEGELKSTFWSPKAKSQPFTTSDGEQFSIYFSEEAPGIFNVAFSRRVGNAGGTFGITGQGNVGEIFRIVYAIIRKFIQNNHPKQIKFTAKEESREKLYRAMIKRLAPSGSTWDEYENGDEVEFTVDFA